MKATKLDRAEPIVISELVYQSLGNYKRAMEYLEKYLSISKETGDRAAEGRAFGNLCTDCHCLGKVEEALDYYMQRLSVVKELKDKVGEGSAYCNIGNAYQDFGKFEEAINNHRKHQSIAKEIGDRNQEGMSYCDLGAAYKSLGDFQKAKEYQEQDLQIDRVPQETFVHWTSTTRNVCALPKN